MNSTKWTLTAFVFALMGWIVFFTGPNKLNTYPSSTDSPYFLPWAAGQSHFVSQGNRSFTTHRGFYKYSWDFWMSVGTEFLAARGGLVTEVIDDLNGVGFFHGNRIVITQEDGTHAVYAHIRKNGSAVRVGEQVIQGQRLGFSGMVGFTINPHLHFHVLNPEKTSTIPITFKDVTGGIPYAGRFYTSGNR